MWYISVIKHILIVICLIINDQWRELSFHVFSSNRYSIVKQNKIIIFWKEKRFLKNLFTTLWLEYCFGIQKIKLKSVDIWDPEIDDFKRATILSLHDYIPKTRQHVCYSSSTSFIKLETVKRFPILSVLSYQLAYINSCLKYKRLIIYTIT